MAADSVPRMKRSKAKHKGKTPGKATLPDCRECGRRAPVAVESGRCRKCDGSRGK